MTTVPPSGWPPADCAAARSALQPSRRAAGFGRSLVVALEGVEAEIDAWRKTRRSKEMRVPSPAPLRGDRPRSRRLRRGRRQCLLSKSVVSKPLLFDSAQTGQHCVAHRACGVDGLQLDQRHLYTRRAAVRVRRSRRQSHRRRLPPPPGRLGPRSPGDGSRTEHCHACGECPPTKMQPAHCPLPNPGCNLRDFLVREASCDAIHDGGLAAAGLIGKHGRLDLGRRQILR